MAGWLLVAGGVSRSGGSGIWVVVVVLPFDDGLLSVMVAS